MIILAQVWAIYCYHFYWLYLKSIFLKNDEPLNPKDLVIFWIPYMIETFSGRKLEFMVTAQVYILIFINTDNNLC